jgi:hypothetical protein
MSSRKKSNRGRNFGKNRPKAFCSLVKPDVSAIMDPMKSREAWHWWLAQFDETGINSIRQQSKTLIPK